MATYAPARLSPAASGRCTALLLAGTYRSESAVDLCRVAALDAGVVACEPPAAPAVFDTVEVPIAAVSEITFGPHAMRPTGL